MPARVKPHKKSEIQSVKQAKTLTGILHQHKTLQDEIEEADRAEKAKSEAPPFTNKALYCFSPENKFRK